MWKQTQDLEVLCLGEGEKLYDHNMMGVRLISPSLILPTLISPTKMVFVLFRLLIFLNVFMWVLSALKVRDG